MNRWIGIVALAGALAGCGNPAEESDEPEVAATPAAAPTSSAGTYDVTLTDGSKFTAKLNPDGTYQDLAADGSVAEQGTWSDRDGRTCFDSEGGDDTIVCFTLGESAADGSMVATPDDGSEPLTIRKTG